MEKRLFTIVINGNDAADTAVLLRARLAALGDAVSGTIQVQTNRAVPESETAYTYAGGVHDTPSLSVEKILDALADRGWVRLETAELTPEEEEQIRARLQDLGYVD
ncbi:MAG TPA: hypothetical protein ENN29_13920 [Candidatus Hydrogenedentes bacterium]|nr:hypothetical protein [Candidatus Hydrogenedentota bacterium]